MPLASFASLASLALLAFPLYADGTLSFQSGDFPLGSFQNVELDYAGKLTLTSRWDLSETSLEARYWTGFAFDETRGKALVFGGVNASAAKLGDTWLWSADSASWLQKTPPGPPSARYGHALAWAGDKFLLFGGASSSDTWVYDVNADTWGLVAAQISPPADLSMPVMAYDSGRGKVLLFGGGKGNTTWIYHISASSWSSHALAAAPGDRLGAAGAYDKSSGKIILFGGKTPGASTPLGDTWSFDMAGLSWTELNPSSSPSARSEASMVYYPAAGRIVLYGGRSGGVETANSETHYFDYANNRWSQAFFSNNTYPPGRFGHGMIYDTANKKALVFGGKAYMGEVTASLWSHVFRSSGSAFSNAKDVSGITPIVWSTITVSLAETGPGIDILFQIASSSDSINYDSYRGLDGSTSSYYSSTGPPLALWSGHNNRRYLKLKSDFTAGDPPARPRLNSAALTYNQAPSAPVLTSPSNGGRVNISDPVFRWQLAADPDGLNDLPVVYHLQVSTYLNFMLTAVSQEAIGQGSSDVSYAPSTPLPSDQWYWRARAKDKHGLYGDWSQTFSLVIDTMTPPGPVTQATAAIGPANNEIALYWTFPGDDKGSVSGGLQKIRYLKTGPISDEAAWVSAASCERSSLLSATSGQNLITVVGGLETAASYYFAVKTQDEAGNLSPLSLVSPYAMTNASPTVTLTSPAGGEVFAGTAAVAWQVSDPNSGDSLAVSLWISSDSGANYNALLTSGPAAGAAHYYWDTRKNSNGSNYRLRAIVSDLRGLRAWHDTPADFRLDNANEPPVVELTSAPSAGQKIQGPFLLAWRVSDPNSYQTHIFDIWLSPSSDSNYFNVASDLQQSSITIDTLSFGARWGLGSLSTYRLKVTVRDSGSPPLSSDAVSLVFEAVTSPLYSLNLNKPLENDFPAIFDLEFSWQASQSLAHDAVYTLKYSTEPLLSDSVVQSNLSALSYKPIIGSLALDTTYYWQVLAKDSQGRETLSLVRCFYMSSNKAKSKDGRAVINVISGLPAGGYLSIEPPGAAYTAEITLANQDSQAGLLHKVISTTSWHLGVKDISGHALAGGSVEAQVSFVYADSDSDGREDSSLLPADQLKIAKLNESRSRWEFIPSANAVDQSQKTVSARVQGFSVFSLMASAKAGTRLFGVTNFPNPFDPRTESSRIRYVLTENAGVTVRFYTLLGDLVRVMNFGPGSIGGLGALNGYTNEVIWDGRNGDGTMAANGMYLAVIEADFGTGKERVVRKIGVVK
ncbi:MAG: hypothetical protein HY747_07140 [Elusimicrobia bacterium]|nr:hypothetical protein [Elusimicrobiota bacterium]